ncbi:hypothetical protein HAX54_042789 [Datura stramonium]|uniref:Uncharacterized protein n=1 Tax=Datura stramonium TaxID=4076 RepID=A0ABS8SMI3_DATST|nr:hypothetical protein [Datura stramonium]
MTVRWQIWVWSAVVTVLCKFGYGRPGFAGVNMVEIDGGNGEGGVHGAGAAVVSEDKVRVAERKGFHGGQWEGEEGGGGTGEDERK